MFLTTQFLNFREYSHQRHLTIDIHIYLVDFIDCFENKKFYSIFFLGEKSETPYCLTKLIKIS